MEFVNHAHVELYLIVILKQHVFHAPVDTLQQKDRVVVNYAHPLNIPMMERVVVHLVALDLK